MIKGWLIGDFKPSILRTKDFEIGLKRYKKGDNESEHIHKVATEITMIVEGQARMDGILLNKGDIILIDPGESTDFQALKDTATLVIKIPSIIGDKYETHIS